MAFADHQTGALHGHLYFHTQSWGYAVLRSDMPAPGAQLLIMWQPAAQTFLDITRGLRWPAGPAGGALRAARHMRVLDKPTLGEYTTMVVMDHAPLPLLPGPITSDTQAR